VRAVALDFERKQLIDTQVDSPCLVRPDQVLFRVREVGVCGTDRDLSAFRLGFPPRGETILVLGHEAAGQVVEIGSAVKDLTPGDWVVPTVRRSCSPPCASCRRGRRDLCLTGASLERGIAGLHGYFSDYALDSREDLVRVPGALADYAVLMEPLSVVEKVIETALRLHAGEPATALVLGAGPIGLLAALALQARGLEPSIYSLEPPDHPRARLAAAAGIRYVESLAGVAADVIVEAAGSAEAALRSLQCLRPLGVCGILGAPNASGMMPFRNLLLNNQIVFGSVNASPQSFRAALEDLGRFDRGILDRMIRRVAFSEFRETIFNPAPDAPKLVHVLTS
jgi:threonine dehydrogenase-like Zn-dependent dehydrogenase